MVIGNYIGTDATGSQPLGNAEGVWIMDGAQGNVIGGLTPGEGNLIANSTTGVVVEGPQTTGNTVRGNSIYSNWRWGIHNETGGNNELEPPTLTSASPLAGSACPNCTVDIYSDSQGEGETYEGSTVADGEGNFTFDGSPSGPMVTATATDSNGSTSEFSQPLPGQAR
jgi:titin